MPYQFRHYDVITTLEQHNDSSTYLVSTRDQARQKAILKVFHKPAILSLEKREKFFQYIDMLMRIKHSHIVPIIDRDIEKGSAYVVSEYMAGGSLPARLNRTLPERLPFEEALSIVSQVGQALVYLHAQAIVYGHLKPKHIIFDMSGHTLLSDIYLPEPGASEQETSLDSLRYLAPEQCQDVSSAQTTTALSDQYALCCLAYELFTGRVPFTTTDISELKEQQLYMRPAPLTSIVADVPDSVSEAILKGLEKDPSLRYPTITALLTALQTLSQATTHTDIPIIAAGQTRGFIPPSTPNTPNSDVVAHFTSYDRPTPGSITRSTSQTLATLWHPFNTATNTRQKKVWLGSAILTILCCLLVYITFAIYSPPVALTHGEAHTQTTTPASATQVVHTRLIPTPTSVVTRHPRPTATARPQSNPTPTPTTAPPTPTPVPTVTTAILPLFTGQLSAQTEQRDTYPTNFIATNFISQLTVSNVRIEADISISGNMGGIAFRSSQKASIGYRFFISTNGWYELLTASRAIATGFSPAIKTGRDVANHITIVAVGSTITIAVNTKSIVSASNGDYSSGYVGVMAVGFNQSTVTTCNFSIYTAG